MLDYIRQKRFLVLSGGQFVLRVVPLLVLLGKKFAIF